MTVIVNAFWRGVVSQVVDRHITINRGFGNYKVVDSDSNKVCVVLARDAFVSIAYTGIAISNQIWMDSIIANCLSHRELSCSACQPGTAYLNRSINTIIDELRLNLNGCLNSDPKARLYGLRVSIVGFHLGGAYSPLCWELSREIDGANGNKYFKLIRNPVGKYLREHPIGIWCETLGDPGTTVNEGMQEVGNLPVLTHDEIERYVAGLIRMRSREIKTVGPNCLAVQLDPFKECGQVQVTLYPSEKSPFVTPWVMTSRMISAPCFSSSSIHKMSECEKYVVGGFEDGNTNLSVIARVPGEFKQEFDGLWVFSAKKREKTF